ncbi:MAG: hypothetical protein AB1805_03615 [Nitrospirota bacterium]
MEKSDIELLQHVMDQISRSAFEFGQKILPVLQKFRDEMTEYYKTIYPILRKEYESAGCPYGNDDESMWDWLKGKARRTEEQEMPEIPETEDAFWAKDLLKLREYMKDRVN